MLDRFYLHISGARLLSTAAFALALLLVIAAAVAASLNLQRLRNSFAWVEHTQSVMLQAGTIETDLASAVAARQTALLTGDAGQSARFNSLRTETGAQLDILASLVADNAAQLERLRVLRPLIEKRLDQLERAALPGQPPSRNLSVFPPGGNVIRQQLHAFRDAEVALLNERQRQAEQETALSTTLAAATVMLAIGAAAVGAFLLQRERQQAQTRELQMQLLHVSRLNTVGQIAAALAHEVNQPLAAARNYIGAAQRLLQASPVQVERVADVMQRSAAQVDRASEIIRRLRRFISRPDSERSPEQVAEVVAEAITLSALQRADSRIVQSVAPGLPAVSIDKVQIQQVLVNLMRNALEAMADSARKELEIAAQPEGTEAIRITVRDSGPGLLPEVASKLFQPFVTTKDSGMGVGLSICRRIVEGHGGRIWAEPASGGGTAFHFTIPAAEPLAVAQTATDAAAHGSQVA